MNYQGKMEVPQDILLQMNKLCEEHDGSLGKYEVPFDEEYDFGNGLVMAIQVCSGEDDPAWTQGVLFHKVIDESGEIGLIEVGCTEVGERLDGEYNVDFEGNVYTVVVVPKKQYYKTVIQIEILSEEPYPDPRPLEDISYDITEGHCSGVLKTVSSEKVDGPTMAKLLQEQESDPEFFGLDENGNEIDEDLFDNLTDFEG